MFDDNDWFNLLIRIFIVVLALAWLFILGLVLGGAYLLSEFAR